MAPAAGNAMPFASFSILQGSQLLFARVSDRIIPEEHRIENITPQTQ